MCTFQKANENKNQKRKTIDIISHFFVNYTPNRYVCVLNAPSMHFRVAM